MSSIEASFERQIRNWRERHPRLGFAVWAAVAIEVALWAANNAIRPVIDTASEIEFLFDNWHLVRTAVFPILSHIYHFASSTATVLVIMLLGIAYLVLDRRVARFEVQHPSPNLDLIRAGLKRVRVGLIGVDGFRDLLVTNRIQFIIEGFNDSGFPVSIRRYLEGSIGFGFYGPDGGVKYKDGSSEEIPPPPQLNLDRSQFEVASNEPFYLVIDQSLTGRLVAEINMALSPILPQPSPPKRGIHFRLDALKIVASVVGVSSEDAKLRLWDGIECRPGVAMHRVLDLRAKMSVALKSA